MAALWVAYAALVVFAVAGIAIYPWLRRDKVLRSVVKKRFLVFRLDGGAPFDGLLVEMDEQTFVFADVHSRGAAPGEAAPGLLYLARERIDYMQFVVAEQGGPPLVVVQEPDQPKTDIGAPSPFTTVA